MYDEPSTRKTWSPLAGALTGMGAAEALGDVFGMGRNLRIFAAIDSLRIGVLVIFPPRNRLYRRLFHESQHLATQGDHRILSVIAIGFRRGRGSVIAARPSFSFIHSDHMPLSANVRVSPRRQML